MGAVSLEMTRSGGTLQNRAILSRTFWDTGPSQRQRITSGWMPRPSSSFTECWVGLLLGSPVPGMETMRETWR